MVQTWGLAKIGIINGFDMVYVTWIVSISSIAISPVKASEKTLRGGYTKFEPGKGIPQINACW